MKVSRLVCRSLGCWLLLGLALALGAPGCAKEGEFVTKREIPREDFGTEVFNILRREMSWSKSNADAKVAVLDESRLELINALNAMIDQPVRSDLQDALVKILPLYDFKPDGSPGELPELTQDLARILERLLLDNRTLDALSKLDAGKGAPPDATNRLIYRFLQYEKELFPTLAKLFSEQEPLLNELFLYLHYKLPTLEDVDPPELPTLGERFLKEDETLVSTSPAYSLLLDSKGNPLVTYKNGKPLPPFIDNDNNGEVDTDAFGNPIDAQGKVIDIKPFTAQTGPGIARDEYGRAFVGVDPLYRYIDMRKTLLAMMLQDAGEILKRDYHLQLITALEPLLGTRTSRKDPEGTFLGYEGSFNPLLDLLYAGNMLRRYPRLPQTIQILAEVARQKPTLLVGLVTELAKMIEIFSGPDLLAPKNTFFEEFHPYLELLAKNGLLADVLRAMADPRIKNLPTSLGDMLRYSELDLPADMSNLKTPSDVDNLDYKTETDWTKSDQDGDQYKSLFQKTQALIYYTNRAPLAVKLFDQINLPFLTITDNMAAFYILGVAGKAKLDVPLADQAVNLIDEFDDTTPTAEQLNLFLNHDQQLLGNATDNVGKQVRFHYGDMLLALQRTGMLDVLRPLAEAFVNKGKEELFVDLLSLVHEHYGSNVKNETKDVSKGTNIRATEPKLLRLVDETTFLSKVIELSTFLSTLEITHRGEKLNAIDELSKFVRYLTDTEEPLVTRDGRAWVFSGACGNVRFKIKANGEPELDQNLSPIPECTKRVEKISRLHILFDALDNVKYRLERPVSDPTAEELRKKGKTAWDAIDIVDVLLAIENGKLKNETTAPLIVNLLPVLADHFEREFYKPSYLTDIDKGFADLKAFFESRGFAAVVDIVKLLRDTPEYRDTINPLLVRLLDPNQTGERDLYGAVLMFLSDSIQFRVDPNAGTQMLRYLAAVLQPEDRLLFRVIEAANKMYQLDDKRTLVELAKNLMRESPVGVFPINAMGLVIKQLHRAVPNAPGPRTATDFKFIVEKMVDYLRDKEKGVERLYTIIRGRK
ncbi:MAG: hypothetical protein KC609_23810 [Myxococcales bacterium]|nr:hypothetical protein [Myxococcales bacterium]